LELEMGIDQTQTHRNQNCILDEDKQNEIPVKMCLI
jgi:hypothetical protein